MPLIPLLSDHLTRGKKEKLLLELEGLKIRRISLLITELLQRIAIRLPDYNLVIYGEGNKREELEKLVKDQNLKDRVSLPGNIQNIADEMEKNSMFVLSSDFEGMPNALMEAMAFGLPCISTDCPCGGPDFNSNWRKWSPWFLLVMRRRWLRQ